MVIDNLDFRSYTTIIFTILASHHFTILLSNYLTISLYII